MINIREAVAERIANSGELVAERVVDALADTTLQKREQQVSQAITESDNLARDLQKLKPDALTFNQDGTVAAEAFTKARIEQRAKLKSRIEKIENALAKALEKNDWNPIAHLGGKDTPAAAADDQS